MSEHDPSMRLSIGSKEFLATPSNAHLYTHIGRLAMYDHLFLIEDTEGEELTGMFVFKQLHVQEEAFTEIGNFMANNGFHCDINRTQAAEGDIAQYDAVIAAMVGDLEIPDDWN